MLYCDFQFTPGKKEVLFGYHEFEYTDPKNFILILFKKFVWINKFKNCRLDFDRFKSYIKTNIIDLVYMLEIKGEDKKISEWDTIINAL